ncbi:MAG: hypothetical protein JXO22_18000 [Phycisphaerae bacterium]|nr:hypothetical protein [Phycisphaerae bacterium]
MIRLDLAASGDPLAVTDGWLARDGVVTLAQVRQLLISSAVDWPRFMAET